MNVKHEKSNAVTETSGITLASNEYRKKLIIGNRDASNTIYVGFSATNVSSTNYHVKIAAGENYEIDNFTGTALSNDADTEWLEFI
jgi:hypothetical protein